VQCSCLATALSFDVQSLPTCASSATHHVDGLAEGGHDVALGRGHTHQLLQKHICHDQNTCQLYVASLREESSR